MALITKSCVVNADVLIATSLQISFIASRVDLSWSNVHSFCNVVNFNNIFITRIFQFISQRNLTLGKTIVIRNGINLELHVVSTFWLGSDTSGTFSLYFAQQSYELERPALKMHILWCRTDICSCKHSAKVSFMLDNPFPVPSFCKLNHISVCFIKISTKITCKQLSPFRESHVF